MCLGLLLSVWAVFAWAAPIQVVDDRNQHLELPEPAQRVVSMLPSLTETVCELGACERLVGVDRYSNWPKAVQNLPKVGGGMDPNIEAIVALKPDLVLVATSSRGARRLEALGLKVLALEPKTHADVKRLVFTLGKVLGLNATKAEQMWHSIDAAMSAAAESLPVAARHTRVYFEVSQGPYAAGAKSFIGQTLTRLGIGNVVPVELGPFPKLNPEFVVRADPDLIVVGARNMQNMLARPGWQHMRAVREQNICVLGSEDEDAVVRLGPRMAEGARALANCVHKHFISRGGQRPVP